MDLREAKEFLNGKGYVLVEKASAEQIERWKKWAIEDSIDSLAHSSVNEKTVETVKEFYNKLKASGLGKVDNYTPINTVYTHHREISDITIPEEYFEERGMTGKDPQGFGYEVKCAIGKKYYLGIYTQNFQYTTRVSSYYLAKESDEKQDIIRTYAQLDAPICKKLWDDKKEEISLDADEVVDFLNELVNFEIDDGKQNKLDQIKAAQAAKDDEIYNFEKGLRYHGN